MSEGRIRVSIANLSWEVVDDRSHERRRIAVLSPKKLAKGIRMWTALGGAGMLTSEGRQYLENKFDAADFEIDPNDGRTFDMRFAVPLCEVDHVFASLREPLTNGEKNPSLDIFHELTREPMNGMPSILFRSELSYVSCRYSRTVVQPELVGTDTSSRATATPTRRMFRIFELSMPCGLITTMLSHPMVSELTATELATTHGGSEEGYTSRGDRIANNLFL